MRKKELKKTSGGDVMTAIDVDSPTSDYVRTYGHRTCWRHVLAVQLARARTKRIRKKQAEEIESFKLTSPCFLETFPHRERTKRKSKNKNTLSRFQKELNTEVFDCFFKQLWKSFSEDKRMPFGYIDSVWFNMYRNRFSKENVLKWIKRRDIFSKRYVLIPICCWGHWNLLIFCHFGESVQSGDRKRCMLLLDSLQMAEPRRIEPEIRKFVLDIFKSEGKSENKQSISRIPLLVPKVPQQQNGEECGKYVLQFINLFVQHAPDNFSMEDYPYFMKDDWFSLEAYQQFCETLEMVEV